MSTVTKQRRTRKPFTLGPHPDLLYLTPTLQTTIFKVQWVIDQRAGLTAVLGDAGMGKSTVMRYLFSKYVGRDDTVTSFITTPNFPTDFAFLKAICADFNLPPRRSMGAQEAELRGFLIECYEQDKGVILFLDEAQKLSGKQLELIRVLLNFETPEDKLIQIIIAGQLELRTKLMDETKKALRSRIFVPSLLAPLSLTEAQQMISFRCEQAVINNPFPDDILEYIYARAGGIPREILKVCSFAYALAQQSGAKEVSRELADLAADEAALHDESEA
jgi:general secretion pathway protein A